MSEARKLGSHEPGDNANVTVTAPDEDHPHENGVRTPTSPAISLKSLPLPANQPSTPSERRDDVSAPEESPSSIRRDRDDDMALQMPGSFNLEDDEPSHHSWNDLLSRLSLSGNRTRQTQK